MKRRGKLFCVWFVSMVFIVAVLICAMKFDSIFAAEQEQTEEVETAAQVETEAVIVIEEPTEAETEPVVELIGPGEETTEAETEPITEAVSVEEAGRNNEDINLLAIITMAEAENQSEYGQRLVIDTVLNRVDSPHFPNNVHDVIYQKGHFSPIADGRFNQCYVKDSIRNLVLEELDSRTNSDVIYFRTKKYSVYGHSLFKEGDHYFSSY